MTIEQIASNGDLVLEVGAEGAAIRVHSLFLKEASIPFASLLSPQWSEGQRPRDPDGSIRLALPDDDPQAMTAICALLHHKHDMLPKEVAAREVLKIAVVADKYDLAQAVLPAVRVWRKPRSVNDMLCFMAAAFLCRDVASFRELTRNLVLDHNGSLLGLTDELHERSVPGEILCEFTANEAWSVCVLNLRWS